MSIQFSLGKSLVRAAVSLGFVGCLMAAGTISSQVVMESAVGASKAETGEGVAMPSVCGGWGADPNSCAGLMLTVQVEIGLPDEFGIVFEDDSIEMLRVDIERRTFRIDRDLIGPGIASKIARNIGPTISPPLLV